MGENAFHMVFQERWVFSNSSPNPALAATRLWAGYGELMGENSISPGKPCEMHTISLPYSCHIPKLHICKIRMHTYPQISQKIPKLANACPYYQERCIICQKFGEKR